MCRAVSCVVVPYRAVLQHCDIQITMLYSIVICISCAVVSCHSVFCLPVLFVLPCFVSYCTAPCQITTRMLIRSQSPDYFIRPVLVFIFQRKRCQVRAPRLVIFRSSIATKDNHPYVEQSRCRHHIVSFPFCYLPPPPSLVPSEDIRSYFGESVALYFSFLGFYTAALCGPAALGVLQLVCSVDTLHEYALYSLFNMLWVTVFLEVSAILSSPGCLRVASVMIRAGDTAWRDQISNDATIWFAAKAVTVHPVAA